MFRSETRSVRSRPAPTFEDLDLGEIGPEIENSGLFPNRTNVSFFRVSGSRVRARIFERGVGETLSSGTGASGAAVAAFLDGAPSPITVELDGGELLVEISPELEVNLTGWAEPILSGNFSDEFSETLRAQLTRLETKENPWHSQIHRRGSRRCLRTCSPSWSGG